MAKVKNFKEFLRVLEGKTDEEISPSPIHPSKIDILDEEVLEHLFTRFLLGFSNVHIHLVQDSFTWSTVSLEFSNFMTSEFRTARELAVEEDEDFGAEDVYVPISDELRSVVELLVRHYLEKDPVNTNIDLDDLAMRWANYVRDRKDRGFVVPLPYPGNAAAENRNVRIA